jgi:hypothetical protein
VTSTTTTTATSAGQGRADGGGGDDDKAKTLPVCFRFKLGSCFDAQCPYPHINVNPRAAVCEAFLAGYCPQGSACKLLHTYECQTWVRTGECDDPQCRFKHPRNVRGRQRTAPDESAAPSVGTLAASSLPPLSSSIVASDEQRREATEEDEEEASDDGRSRFRGTRDDKDDEDEDDDEEDGSNSDRSLVPAVCVVSGAVSDTVSDLTRAVPVAMSTRTSDAGWTRCPTC